MTPSNTSQMASIKEWQRYFKEAFDIAAASPSIAYNTGTITGGVIFAKNITINSGQTLTISNPTTFICESFVNNGTITMRPVLESVLSKYRSTNSRVFPEYYNPLKKQYLVPAVNATWGGNGGASYGYGGGSSITDEGSLSGGVRRFHSPGWLQLGVTALWWPIGLFRNPIAANGSAYDACSRGFVATLAYQQRGTLGFNTTNAGAYTPLVRAEVSPGSFIEVFCKTFNNPVGSTITARGQNGTLGTNFEVGGGGGGGIGVYAETSLIQAGTLTANGGNGTTTLQPAGGGGGGGIFLTSPVLTVTGTNNVNGGAGNAGGANGGAGLVLTEKYLRLWTGTSSQSTPVIEDTIGDSR